MFRNNPIVVFRNPPPPDTIERLSTWSPPRC